MTLRLSILRLVSLVPTLANPNSLTHEHVVGISPQIGGGHKTHTPPFTPFFILVIILIILGTLFGGG